MAGRTACIPSHPGNSGALLPHHPSPKQHNQLTLRIYPSKTTYIAGEKVSGLLELDVLIGNNKLSLGELGIEFTGLEELRSLDHTATRILLTSRLDFQGPTLSPSAAIAPNSLPINGSFYPALKGRTRFPFSFTLPSASPSSCSLGANATTRYELRAFASSLLNSEVDIKTERKEIKVVERWGDWEVGNWTEGCLRRGGETLKLGGEGKLEMMAEIGKDGSGRLFWRTEREAGMEGNGSVKVRVKVRNGTKKHVSGLRLSICRRLRILDPKASGMSMRAPIITSTIVLDHFRGIGFEFPVGEEREVFINTEVPLDESWTVRKGTLFELDVFLRVEVECGFLTKDLAVELPIWIAHPRSLPPACHAHRQRINTQIAPVLPPITHQPFPGSRNAMSPVDSGYSYPYAQPLAQPYDPYSTEFGRLSPAQHPFPTSTSAPMLYHQQHPQHQQHPHHPQYIAQVPYPVNPQYGARPHYPPPTPPVGVGRGTPSPIPAPYYIAFDPYSPDLTQSKFLASINHHQPQQSIISSEIVYSPPPMISQPHQQYQPLPQPPQIISRPASSNDIRHLTTSPISTTLSPPPATYSPTVERSTSPVERPLSSRSFRPHEAGLVVEASLQGMMESELERVKANVAPLEPYSAKLRASMSKEDLRASLMVAGRSNTAPLPLSLPIVVDVPTTSNPPSRYEPPRSHTASSIIRPSKTPPPPPPLAPSSRFATPSRSPSPSTRTLPSNFIEENETTVGVSLDTIGEDGESQAGTTRSMHDLAALLKRDDSYHSVQADGNSPGRNSVSDLEDLVDEEDRRVELEKSLPRLPLLGLSSGGEGRKDSGKVGVMRAQDIFSPLINAVPIESPPVSTTPTLAPPLIRSDRGLKALEARLSRPSTPESSTLPTSITIRPMPPQDSTTAAPAAFKSGALRARSLSRVTSEKNLAKMLTNVEPKEEVRKALESKRKDDAIREKEKEKEPDVLRPTAVRSTTTTSSKNQVLSDAAASSLDQSINTSPLAASTSSTSIDSSSSSIPLARYVDGRKVVDIAEIKDLKKEAASRVSDWMNPSTSTSKPLKRSTFDFVRHAPPPPTSSSNHQTRSPSPEISRSLSSSPTRISPKIERRIIPTVNLEKEPTMEELLKAESRAGRLANPPTSKSAKSFAKKIGNGNDENGARQQENLRELGIPSANEFGARYDVKSARGGRGGVVSSVAGKWASLIDQNENDSQDSAPSSPVVSKALKLNSSVQNTPPRPVTQNPFPSKPLDISSSPTRQSSRPSPIVNRRTQIVASTPIPVVIAKSLPAKAFMNTTIGKPPVLSNNIIAPLDRVTSPVGEGERKGKAGISDLIARYQSQS